MKDLTSMKDLTLDDAVKIANIGMEFGRVVEDAMRYPMNVIKRDELLERMIPYKELFEQMVQASVEELNKRHPRPDSTPRFDYKIE